MKPSRATRAPKAFLLSTVFAALLGPDVSGASAFELDRAISCQERAESPASVRRWLQTASNAAYSSSGWYVLRSPVVVANVRVTRVALIEDEGRPVGYTFTTTATEGQAMVAALGLRKAGTGYALNTSGGSLSLVVGPQRSDFSCFPAGS